jgi:DnaJ-class molecular chaperone
MSLANYLRFLGISFHANPKEIKKAYKKLSKKFYSKRTEVHTSGLNKGYTGG